jgi:hypothetical protein
VPGCPLDDLECNFAGKVSSAVCHRFRSDAGDFETGFCTIPCEGTCPDKSGWAPTFCASLDGGITGRCVAKSHALNGECAEILGTGAASVSRFIGTSGAAAATAVACMPE